ncbi:MAG TPA: xylulokinase [Solirubrobacteraceae bacterium]
MSRPDGPLVGIDVGTSGVKGLAIDHDGTVLAGAEAAYPLSTPRPGWAEQDPEDWWSATVSVLTTLREKAGAPAGIGLAGQMHGLVALDTTDRVLRPAILWNDQRTAAECRQIEDTIGRERLLALTGNRALPGFTAPKLLWMRRHEPDLYARIARVALPKDYVRLRLCGEHVSDVSDASGTLLLDVPARRWSDEVLSALELEHDWLPEVLEGPAVSGQTADGVPVAAGGGDQAAGALGVGVDRPGPVSVVLGTSGVVFAALGTFAADAQGRVHAFCHAVPDSWHVMGVMLSAAGSLRWLRDVVAPGTPYHELIAEAESWPAAGEGLLFLPYLAGERTPHADPDARGAFIGLSVRHNRGALVRALLEGVAFGLRDAFDLVAGLAGRPDVARVSGGGARSECWLRIVASVLELTLERVAVDEGAAFGAAALGGVAAGVWPDVHAAVWGTVRAQDRIDPVPEWIEPYREQLERFRAAYPALRDLGARRTAQPR